MKRPPAQSPGREHGYILALNLAVLALMLMGASYVGQRVFDAVRLARAEQQSVDVDYQLESARARLLMLLATTPRSTQGVGTPQANVALDGTDYRMGDDVIVSLQDVRGLVSLNGINLNGFGRERVERLLGTWGVADVKAVSLTDALLDYRDADDFRRINGAERADYRAVGAEADLRNGDLLSPTELSRVFGWRDTPQLWGPDPVTDYVSTQRGSTFNPNTASWRALVAMAGIDATTAKSLVATRQLGSRADISGLVFGASVGDPFGPMSFVSPFPSPTLLITLRSAQAPWGYRFMATHTPGENTAPWRIGAAWRVALEPPAKPLRDIPALPEAASLRDLNATGQIKLPF